jgi:hypothetical protein
VFEFFDLTWLSAWVQALSEIVGNHSARYWVPYLRTHLIYNLSPLLSEKFLNATFKLDADLQGMSSTPSPASPTR